MARTRDYIVDEETTFSAKGKNAIYFQGADKGKIDETSFKIENGNLTFTADGKTYTVSDYQGIRYIKTDKTEGEKTTQELTDIISNNYVSNVVAYDEKRHSAAGTQYNDTIDLNGVTEPVREIKNRAGEVTARIGVTVDGGVGNDTITGTAFNDTLRGGAGDDTITGGKGDDTITGGVGKNTVIYTKGDGNDVINLTRGENFTLQLNGVTDVSDLKFEYANRNRDLRIYTDKNSTDEYITVKNFGAKDVTNNATRRSEDTSSVELKVGNNDAVDLRKYVYTTTTDKNFTGTWLNDSIDASEMTTPVKTVKNRKGEVTAEIGVTLNGENGDDTVTGSKYNDTINGGNGDDVINAGAGDDTVTGGRGENTINYTSGNDTIYLTKGETLKLNLDNVTITDIAQGTGRGKNDLVLTTGEGTITLKNYYAKDTGATVNIKDATMTDYQDFAKVVKFAAVDKTYFQPEGGRVRTSYTGSALADEIDASEVYLTKTTGRGKNRQTVELAAKDRGLTLRGGNGDDVITGSKYSDTIQGGVGDDTINGSLGNDKITGGVGHNTVKYDDIDKIDGDKIYLTKGENLTIDMSEIGLGEDNITYEVKGRDLVITATDGDNTKSLTLVNFGTKDVTNNATRRTEDTSSVELKLTNTETVDLREDVVVNSQNGTWHNDYIDRSDYKLYKDKRKTLVQDNTAKRGLTLNGGNGNDTIIGTNYSDTIKGGNGDDIITGGTGNDTLFGNNGNDTLNGGDGNDKIYGGKGNDTINAGEGNNYIYLNKGDGNDVIENGNGVDTLVFANRTKLSYSYDKFDLIVNYGNNDTVRLKDYLKGHSVKYVQIGRKRTAFNPPEPQIEKSYDGNYTVIEGTYANDVITTDNNDQKINAYEGNNTITTGNGNDIIVCGDGDNVINGGNGNNNISLGNGNNNVITNEGNNIITVGAGNNNINTGSGDDVLNLGDGHNDITFNTNSGNDTINLANGTQTLKINYDDSDGDTDFTYTKNGDDLTITKTYTAKEITDTVYKDYNGKLTLDNTTTYKNKQIDVYLDENGNLTKNSAEIKNNRKANGTYYYDINGDITSSDTSTYYNEYKYHGIYSVCIYNSYDKNGKEISSAIVILPENTSFNRTISNSSGYTTIKAAPFGPADVYYNKVYNRYELSRGPYTISNDMVMSSVYYDKNGYLTTVSSYTVNNKLVNEIYYEDYYGNITKDSTTILNNEKAEQGKYYLDLDKNVITDKLVVTDNINIPDYFNSDKNNTTIQFNNSNETNLSEYINNKSYENYNLSDNGSNTDIISTNTRGTIILPENVEITYEHNTANDDLIIKYGNSSVTLKDYFLGNHSVQRIGDDNISDLINNNINETYSLIDNGQNTDIISNGGNDKLIFPDGSKLVYENNDKDLIIKYGNSSATLKDYFVGNHSVKKIGENNIDDLIKNNLNEIITLTDDGQNADIVSNGGIDTLIFPEKTELTYEHDLSNNDLVIKYGNSSATLKDYFLGNHSVKNIGENNIDDLIKNNINEIYTITDTHKVTSIISNGGNDTLVLPNDSDVSYKRNNDDLIVNYYYNSGSVVLKDYYKNEHSVKNIKLGNKTLSVAEESEKYQRYHQSIETLYLTKGFILHGKNGNDSIDTDFDNSEIYGDDGNDEIIVEGNNNIIYGGKGNDYILLDYDNKNTVVFNRGDGNDILDNDSNKISIIFNDSSIDNIKLEKLKNNDLIVKYSNNDNIKIINDNDYNIITLHDENGITKTLNELIKSYGEIPLSSETINFGSHGVNENYIKDITEEGNNKTITGSNGDDYIYNSGNHNTIYAGKGNDSIHIVNGTAEENGYENTTVTTNTVVFNQGDGKDRLYIDEKCNVVLQFKDTTSYPDNIKVYGNVIYVYYNSNKDCIYIDNGNNEDLSNISLQSKTGIYWVLSNYMKTKGIIEFSGSEINGTDDDDWIKLYGITSGKGNDEYNVAIDKKTIITDPMGNDVLNITSNESASDLSIVFNVDKNYKYTGSDDLSFGDVSILNKEDIDIWENGGKFKGIKIKDNAIETINCGDSSITSADICQLAQNVAGWLTSNDYSDVNAVLDSGKQSDINALVAVFANNTNWTQA